MSAYSTAILADSPQGYWRLGEASGTSGADATGHGNTGIYTAGVTLGAAGAITGDANTAVTLNGTTGWMSVPNAALLNAATFSVELWVYPTGTPGTYYCPISSLYTHDTVGYGYLIYATNSNVWSFDIGNAFTARSAAPVVFNQWAHLVGTYNGTTALLYVNGQQVASGMQTLDLNSVGPMYVGAAEDASVPWQGRLDEVAVYNTVLTAAQIATHYAYGSHILPASYVQATRQPWKLPIVGTVTASPTPGSSLSEVWTPTLPGGSTAVLTGQGTASASIATDIEGTYGLSCVVTDTLSGATATVSGTTLSQAPMRVLRSGTWTATRAKIYNGTTWV